PWSCAYRLQRRSERSSAWPSKRQFPEKKSTRTPLNLASKPTAPICLVHAGSQCPSVPSNVQTALRGAHHGPNLRHKVQAFGVRTDSPDTLVAIANHHRLQDTRCQTPIAPNGSRHPSGARLLYRRSVSPSPPVSDSVGVRHPSHKPPVRYLRSSALSIPRRSFGLMARVASSSCTGTSPRPISSMKREGSRTMSSRARRRFLHQLIFRLRCARVMPTYIRR